MIIKSAILCLALNIYYEARGESEIGAIAVAHVTQNRSIKENTSICHQVFKPNQFSWTRRRWSIPSKDDESWKRSLKIAKSFNKTKDPTNRVLVFLQ